MTPILRGRVCAPRILLAVCVFMCADAIASAQVRQPVRQPEPARRTAGEPRGFLIIDGWYQLPPEDEVDERTLPWNGETANLRITQTPPRTIAFDVAGGVMVARGIGVGVGFSRFSNTATAAAAGSIPHPFFFNQPRQVSGAVTGLERSERSIDIQVRAMFPVSSLQVSVFGGPSFLRVQRDLVTSFRVNESYPFDEATLADVGTTRAEASKVGVHAGVDVAYYFSRNVGVGGGLRFSRATAELTPIDGTTQTVELGGTRVGGGLRLRF